MRVREVMHRPVKTIRPERSVAEAAEQMRRFSIHHLAVIDRGRLVGIITDDDVTRTDYDEPVMKVMTRKVTTIDGDESISRAANKMRGRSIGCLVVTDKDSKPTGILTTNDILSVISRMGHPERMVLRDRGPHRHKTR